jgi:hypothetical protein
VKGGKGPTIKRGCNCPPYHLPPLVNKLTCDLNNYLALALAARHILVCLLFQRKAQKASSFQQRCRVHFPWLVFAPSALLAQIQALAPNQTCTKESPGCPPSWDLRRRTATSASCFSLILGKVALLTMPAPPWLATGPVSERRAQGRLPAAFQGDRHLCVPGSLVPPLQTQQPRLGPQDWAGDGRARGHEF